MNAYGTTSFTDSAGRTFIVDNRPPDYDVIAQLRFDLQSYGYTCWDEDFNALRRKRDFNWFIEQSTVRIKMIIRRSLFRKK